MATPISKRATIAITTPSTNESDKKEKTNNPRMSLDDFKLYLEILSSNSLQKPALSLNPDKQWSIQDSPIISPDSPKNGHYPNQSTVEYSAYLSNIDPNEEKYDLDSLSDASSSYDLDTQSEQDADANILSEYGYKINKLISHNINGCIYSAQVMEQNTDINKNKNKNKYNNKINLPSSVTTKKSLVRIKKYEKDNGDASNITEALILLYLTVQNIPPSPNICKYIDFIESKNAYYLIQELAKNITLDELILTAHKYIKNKRMRKKHWRIIVKYLFWQLIATLYWMHKDMRVCHLELNTMNIIVENAIFIEKNGIFTIDTKNICIKLSDFGQAEIFELDKKFQDLKCSKTDIVSDFFYKDPKVLNGEIFNPIKADMYSVGMILFKMFTGVLPYKQLEKSDTGYMALKSNKFKQYLKLTNMLKGLNKYIIELMVNLLNFNEKQRITTADVIHNEWFKNYYIRYKKSIQQKSKSQRERHIRQMDEYKLPYYKSNK